MAWKRRGGEGRFCFTTKSSFHNMELPNDAFGRQKGIAESQGRQRRQREASRNFRFVRAQLSPPFPSSSPQPHPPLPLFFHPPSLHRPTGLSFASLSMHSESYGSNASGSSSSSSKKERPSNVAQPRTLEPLETPTLDKGKQRASPTYWSDVGPCFRTLLLRSTSRGKRLRGRKKKGFTGSVELTSFPSFPSLALTSSALLRRRLTSTTTSTHHSIFETYVDWSLILPTSKSQHLVVVVGLVSPSSARLVLQTTQPFRSRLSSTSTATSSPQLISMDVYSR